MANSIDSTLLLTNYQSQNKTLGSNTLGKDDFLKILMVQLQNQDPSNPMQDREFISQMATFSTLEQMTNINRSMQQFIEAGEKTNLISYTQFIGKEVSWEKIDDQTQLKTEGTGKIVSIQLNENNPIFLLEDGTSLKLEDVLQINEINRENLMVQSSFLIGKTISFLDANMDEKMGIVKSVLFKNGKTYFQLNDEANTTIDTSQILKIE